MMNLWIWFSFFLLEMATVLICYEHIYRKRNSVNWTIVDFLKALTEYYFFVVKYTRRSSARNRVMDEFLEKNGKLRYALWEYTVLGGTLLLFLPGIIAFLIKHIQRPLLDVMIYLAGWSLLLDKLRESRIVLMSLLNESHRFLFRYQKIRTQMRAKEREGETKEREAEDIKAEDDVQNRALALRMILPAICGSLFLVWAGKSFILRETLKSLSLENSVFLSPLFVIPFLLLSAVYLLNKETRDKVKQRINYWKYLRCKSDIEVCTTEENAEKLSGWIDETLRMCGLLNVKEVGIEIDDTGVKKVFSYAANVHMPIIIIGSEVFEKSKKLYPEEHFAIIRMMIAHELAHIHYKDAKQMKKVYAAALIYIGAAVCIIMIAAKGNLVFGSTVVLLLLVLDIVVFRILRDERYWKQVMELRADRVGMAVSGTTPDLLEKVLVCTAEEEEDNKYEKNNILQKMYQQNIEQQIHPSNERRIYEAKREMPWGAGEYFRYLWMTVRNLNRGKGWRV